MRTMFTVAALVVFVGTVGADDKKFESKEGKFSVKFPGDEKPKVLAQKAGGLDLNITIAEKGKSGFAVIYSDMPADVIKAATPSKLLEGGEKGLVDNFKAKVSKSAETKFTANGKDHPARDITAEKDDLHLQVKIILVDNRLYQVFVVGPKEAVAGKEAEEFLKSFELAK
ncbi:Uncharacterized protein OS=Pseudanabaena biceps PCC 7429 GN=Pse7429DRAFT_4512 PE=4 SV=1 [Gemmata massiliana]|uniref:Uncharacterized protein n=1 Tax=Gemmata massiliana TaxID=1210884 RepID=A0A6P2CRP5_9BACT|nr:hypothetical protein [Gemmata massiliana]VTR90745.1 Uncharacterized protein OS=Pseudanabaena biceps PCC 7429 GN=Pse7429DRAFT_4512 PE=4 SV=1 [Gemmata massiliana]